MKKLILALLCICAATTVQAYAMDVKFERDSQMVTISGIAEKNEHLAIVVTDPEVTVLKGATESLMETHGIGFYEVNADEQGKYSLTFKFDNSDTVCNIFVAGAETSDYKQVTIYSKTSLYKAFNAMINKVQVKDLIGQLQGIYGGDGTIYSKYFGLSNTDSIDKIVYNKKPYSSTDEVYNVFANAVSGYVPPTGGSSGGGGGGGSSITFPAVNPSNTPDAPVQGSVTQTFADVAPDFWGAEAIESLYKKGIVSGINSNEFAPNQAVKREEFVKMLVALIGLDATDKKDTFTDTDKNAWYSPYLAVAQESGLAYGKENGSFGVGEVLTRQDMAVLATRALSTTQRGTAVEFADANEISSYAKNSVEILCGLRIMNGVGDGTFAPKATATRAQAAKVIYEIAKLIK